MPLNRAVVLMSQMNRSPGREIWERQAGQEYTVFVDESFYRFFDFSYRDGNFVHGAFGVPTARYCEFTQAFAPARDEYFQAFREAVGSTPSEIKSADLYKLKFGVRRRLLLKTKSALERSGGFVAGFYTSNRGTVMEAIRVDLIHESGVTQVPEDYASLYDAKVKELNDERRGPGMSGLIANLLFLPVAAVANFLSTFGCPFRIVYDPRQQAEDVAVKNSIEGTMAALGKVEQLGLRSKFLGLEANRPSEAEIGLQLADVIAGEVRRFFRFNADLLTYGSDLKLIGFAIEDAETALMQEIGGRLYKKGRQVKIPKPLLTKALTPTEECALPYIRKLLAAGLVTCITEFGTERDVALFEGVFLDICD